MNDLAPGVNCPKAQVAIDKQPRQWCRRHVGPAAAEGGAHGADRRARKGAGGARVGRPENSVDPEAGPVGRLAWELRRLRAEAGGPSYRALAKKAHYSVSTLAAVTKGDRLPSLEVLLAFAEACGGKPSPRVGGPVAGRPAGQRGVRGTGRPLGARTPGLHPLVPATRRCSSGARSWSEN
ncbi:helix-turn-helix transcriptional regulator [Streptomyces sp. NPDC047049]|uniref:helix-turn-helix domain-containing protein n=1 Tax=Streptomyces sp. NPDC047049 TaxID=3156688 RepID=UPI00340E9212